MKLTMDQFVEQAAEWAKDNFDAVASLEEVDFQSPAALHVPIKGSAEALFNAAGPKTETLMTRHAQLQFAGRLAVPGDWLFDDDRCPNPLRQMVADWKLRNTQAEWMIRMRDKGDALATRAVLSSEYRPYNHDQFARALRDAVETSGIRPNVLMRQWGDEMRAYLVIDEIDFGRHRPDPGSADGGGNGGLHPAVYIGNSEIGTMGVSIGPGTYRSYCDNGVIYGWRDSEHFRIIHRWYSEAEMALKVSEAIVNAFRLSEEAAQKFIETQMVGLKKQRLDDLVETWASKYGLLVSSKEAWQQMVKVHAAEREEYTLYDLVNDASFAARDLDRPDQTAALEILAGRLVEQGVGDIYIAN